MKKGLNLYFLLPYVIALAVGAVLLVEVEKGRDVLFVNGLHTPFLDDLFYYGTSLGNGLLYVVVILMLAWFSFRYSLIALLNFSVTGLLVQFLKKVVFTDAMRPVVLLEGENLHLVEGVKLLRHFSFPSGHTAIAFSLFSFLSLYLKPSWLGLVFIFMALVGGISRIYLVQHFFVDVYFGSILGVVVTVAIWQYMNSRPVLQSSGFLNRSLSAYIRR